jgi:chromate transport protein ChrA
MVPLRAPGVNMQLTRITLGRLKGVLTMGIGAAQTSLMPLLAKLALAFMETGMFTFGSGYAMLGQMQREIVDKHA